MYEGVTMGTTAKLSADQDRAKVLLFPPAAGIGVALIGIILHQAFPADLLDQRAPGLILGILIFTFGIIGQFACIRALRKAKTTPLFKKPVTQFLQRGLYAKSRNPMYVAIMIWNLGLMFIINTWWYVAVLAIQFIYLQFGVIPGEERYLERKFGKDYQNYKSSVPRWL